MADTEIITVKLSKPVEFNNKTYDEIIFAREAEVGDLIAADSQNGEFAKMVAAFASISGVPFPAFRKITARDMQTIMVKAGHLVGNSPQPAEPEAGDTSQA